MTQVNENIFQKFCLISQKVQKMELEINQKNVTPEKRYELHMALESLQGSLEKLRQNASEASSLAKGQFAQLEEMDSQIVSLYRDIEDRFEDYEISLISKGAVDLGSSMESGKMAKVTRVVNNLSHNIHFLFQHRKPSLEHRKIIHLALKLVDHAKELLSMKGDVPKEQMRLIHLLTTLLEEALLRTRQKIPLEEAELAMELYEIADLYYHKKIQEGQVRLNLIRSLLTKSQQRRIDQAQSPEEMVQILLEIADGDPCLEWASSTSSSGDVIHVLHAHHA